MVAGIDRYFQIARCFRDEDLRGDRQPEFTQLDLEMSFVDEDAVMGFVEGMVIEVSRATTPRAADPGQVPFPRFTYARRWSGSARDKPDLRFGMELVDLRRRSRRQAAASACSTRRSPAAAGSRRSSRPGWRRAPRGDRRAHRAREAVRGQGPRPPRVQDGGELHGPIAKFLAEDAGGSSRCRAPAPATSS